MSVLNMGTHWSNMRGPSDEVMKELSKLIHRLDNETPEMWCSRIRNPFKKILGENPRYYSKNDYIQMYSKSYYDGKLNQGRIPTNYIYCTVCDSLIFLPDRWRDVDAETHLRKCIAGIEQGEEVLLQARTQLEGAIWHQKQNILQYKAEIKRIQLELSPQTQSLSHSEKDKLASVTYDYNHISYEAYRAGKASVVKDNTNPFRSSTNPFRRASAPPSVKTQENRSSSEVPRRSKCADYVGSSADAYFDSVRKNANI
jgi:hypothetical protein